MDFFITVFGFFGVVLFFWCFYEAFIVPYLLKNAKANATKELIRQQRLQQDAQELEQRLKEAREWGAQMVERDQRRAKPQKPATRTSQERGGVDILEVAEAFNADIPVQSHRHRDDSWTSYSGGYSDGGSSSSSSSSCDSGSSSSSSSSNCD